MVIDVIMMNILIFSDDGDDVDSNDDDENDDDS